MCLREVGTDQFERVYFWEWGGEPLGGGGGRLRLLRLEVGGADPGEEGPGLTR